MSSKKVCMGKCNDDDRISSLPDDVLCHILSFLPTKFSVRTTILSTRWKLLFTFVPNLYFEYVSPSNHSSSATFIQFVSSVFFIYNVSCMNKFHLDYVNTKYYRYQHCPIFSWISSAIQRQVQVIDIRVKIVSAIVPMSLPLDLFSCKTLTDMTLRGDFKIVLPSLACLPFLRTCVLVGVEFTNESARRLFRNCPALEKLDISSSIGVEVLYISSHTLKNFRIFVWDGHFQLVLNVPNLVYFEYNAKGSVATEFSGLESLKSLVEAAIFYDQNTSIEDSASVELVQGIRHVELLSLLCGPMEGFLRSGHSLPTFNSLTYLVLGAMSKLSSKLLSDLLDSSPHLEFIVFTQMFGDEQDGADQNDYVLPEHVPTCVSLHLREVQFMNFRMLQYECKLIKYFLKHAKNLETMQIQSNRSWDEQFEISSAACRIVYLPEDIEDL